MKILELKICNFKNYQGLHKINLTPDNECKRNIILIGGENGAGKTTIFEAVKLCMFGKQFSGSVIPNKKYLKYIGDAKNKNSIKEKDESYFIEISIELDNVFPVYSITLRREWIFEDSGIKEDFNILRDGIPLEIVSQEYWEDYITRMIPPYITDYFFFDGERMNELTEGDNAENILRESARDLIGLKLYETLIKDLTSLESKIKRKSIQNDNTKKEITDLDDELSQLNEEFDELSGNIIKNQILINEAEIQLEVLNEEIQRKAGVLAKERDKLNSDLKSGKERLLKLNNEIIKICDYVPFVMAGELTKRTLDKLISEKKAKELVANKHLIENVNSRINSNISDVLSEKFDEANIAYVKEGLGKIITGMIKEIDIDTNSEIIHDITNEAFHSIDQYFRVIEEKGKKQFKQHLHDRENLELRLNKIENQLKQVPDDPVINEEIRKINELTERLDLLKEKQKDLEVKKSINESLRKPIETKLTELESGIIKEEEDRRKASSCQNVIDTVNDFIEVILSSKIHELQNMILSMHSQLENKEDMVGDIQIDPKTFSITLFDKNEVKIDKEMMSAGEKEIFALSVLWGLSRLSKSKMPVIVDSLLARLDSSHVNKVATHFLPKAGDQVILLSHDREVDRVIYEKIKPCINQSYVLTYDPVDKIKEGYFF